MGIEKEATEKGIAIEDFQKWKTEEASKIQKSQRTKRSASITSTTVVFGQTHGRTQVLVSSCKEVIRNLQDKVETYNTTESHVEIRKAREEKKTARVTAAIELNNTRKKEMEKKNKEWGKHCNKRAGLAYKRRLTAIPVPGTSPGLPDALDSSFFVPTATTVAAGAACLGLTALTIRRRSTLCLRQRKRMLHEMPRASLNASELEVVKVMYPRDL